MLALAACKVIVLVPFGGKVVSEDGFQCGSGQTCVIEVKDDTFDSTFSAVPDPGFTFARWRLKPAAFCGNGNGTCYLSTTGFAGNQGLLDVLAGDAEFFLEPVFVRYNLGYWQGLMKEIQAGTFATDAFLYALHPDVANCDPGALSAAAQSRALKVLNQVRALHGLPAVSHDGFYDMQTMEASLVQRANNYLSHTPAPGDACYSASAADGAGTSNLSGGSGGSADPAQHILGWTNDNDNLAAVMDAGHRRWMIFPYLGFMSYGQVDGYAALKVFGFGTGPQTPALSVDFVALPYLAYPYPLVSRGAKPTPWSLSVLPQNGAASTFQYFQGAKVTVTDLDTGKQLAVTDLHTNYQGYGLSNFLSWLVSGWQYDQPYTVRISGVRLPAGGTTTIEYPVIVDRYNLLNIDFPLESTDRMASKQRLQGTFNTAKDADSYTFSMNGTKTFTGDSEFSNQGFFIRVYDAGKNLVKSSDKAFTKTFPLGKYTIVVSPCDADGLCFENVKNYTVTIN